MYKEEGNDWIKKNNKKAFQEAYDRYAHALGFMDRALVEHSSGQEMAESLQELYVLKSQILSNRAMASLSLANYGSCRRDCDIAVRIWPGNVKGHFRRCKALYLLKQYSDCITACKEALVVDETNKDIASFLSKSQEELSRRNNDKLRTQQRVTSELHRQWTAVWDLAARERVALGYYSVLNPEPLQLRDAVPHIDQESGDVCWPVLLLYPQYNTFDIVQAAGSADMLVQHLAVMLPEKGDYEQRIDWDRDEEYQASNVVVYASLHGAQVVPSLAEWLQSCSEHRITTSGDTTTIPYTVDAAGNVVSTSTSEEVRRSAAERERLFHAEQDRSTSRKANKTLFLEVHLGCTFAQILRAPGVVAAGGILSLVVFPRGNAAHSKFLQNNAKEGNDIVPLNPV